MSPARWTRRLVGDRPRALLPLALPTLLGLALDLALRGRMIAGFAPQGMAIYASSLLVSAAFWMLPLWIGARLLRRRRASAARVGAISASGFFALWVLPFATFCYGGQALYHRVFHAYMGRDTVRLGIALRGTVADWFGAWGGPWLFAGMVVSGAMVTAGLYAAARAASPALDGPIPLVPAAAFVAALAVFWTDNVDSRFLQAATPDACFVHGVMHALRVSVTGKGSLHQGVSVRAPAPLPKLAATRADAPDVLLILTESVRADALCSAPPPACRAPFLDEVAADRLPLGRLTMQAPNTFSACVMLFTGLPPTADFHTMHAAPVLWELAHAVGRQTAYVTSQNPNYEDFGAFFRNAGIDLLRTATELGGMAQEQLGAPDERAIDELRRFLGALPPTTPYFAVLHLSNTHAPYRTDPGLEPFVPESTDPLGEVQPFENHYRNAVRLQERAIAGLLRELRASPRWDDTVVVVLSDHGEQFREHGGLYHNHSLFEEELRVPGFVVAGPRALSAEQRAALAALGRRRTYTADVHETLVDLLGLEEARGALPYAALVKGRSLLRAQGWTEPTALLATSTSVWEPDDARYGAMRGDRVVIGSPTSGFGCYDLTRDPLELTPLDAAACGELADEAHRAFGDLVPSP